jgi:hypothetical protein
VLARAAEAIASGGLNIEGFAEVEGHLHLLTSDIRAARLALDVSGLRVVGEAEVVLVPIANEAGAAAAVFGRLAAAGINVSYTYLASGNRMVLGVSEPARALAALGA